MKTLADRINAQEPRVLAILTVLMLIACVGCATSRTYRLPPVEADKLTIIHTDSAGKIEASATGIKVTETTITAETARWEVAYPFWHDLVIAEGYKQKRRKDEK